MAELEKMDGMKTLCDICERIEDAVKMELDKGVQNINAQELGLAVDMIKDLAEAKEKVAKMHYYTTITEEMKKEENEYGRDYDERGAYKHYTEPLGRKYDNRMTANDYHDIERMTNGRMYYTEPTNANMDGRMGRSGMSRKRYYESKEHGDNSAKMQSLEEYAKTLTEDVTEMVQGMNENEKQMLRSKMQMLVQKI